MAPSLDGVLAAYSNARMYLRRIKHHTETEGTSVHAQSRISLSRVAETCNILGNLLTKTMGQNTNLANPSSEGRIAPSPQTGHIDRLSKESVSLVFSQYLMELNVLRHDRSISSLHIGRCLPTHVVQLLTKVALPYKVQHIAVHLTQLAFRPVAIANIIALHDGAGSSFDVVYDNRDTPLFTTPLFPWALAIVMESLPTDTVSLEFFVQADNAAPDVDTWHEADESARSTLSLYHRLCPESPHLRPLDVMFMSCPAPIFVNDRIARALCPQTTFCLLQDLTVTTITTQLELDYLCQHLPDTVETLELSIESDHHPLSCELKHAPSLRSFTYTDNLVRADPIDWSSYRGPLLHLPQGVRSVSIPLTFSTIVFEEPDKITHVTLQRCRYTRSSSCCTYNRALGATFAALSESGVENVELTLHLPSKTHFKDEPSARPLTPCDCWTDLLALCREEPLTWIQDLRIHMSRFRPSVYDFMWPLMKMCPSLSNVCFTFRRTMGTTREHRIWMLVRRIVSYSLSPCCVKDDGAEVTKKDDGSWDDVGVDCTRHT